MASRVKSSIKIILKLALAAALIGYMVRSGHLDLSQLWSLMTPFNIAIGIAFAGANLCMAAWRWILLVRARGFDVGMSYGVPLYLIGMFFNHALPGAVGGDLVRGYYLVKDYPNRKVDAVLSIIIDRVLGLYSFFLLTLIAVAMDYEFVFNHEKIRWVAWLCLLIFLGMTAFFTVTFSRRLSDLFGLRFLMNRIQAVNRLVDAFHRFGSDRRTILYSIGVSLIAQSITMLFFYQLAIVIGETDVTWKAVMFAVPMGFVVTAVPISPAGIGVGQVAFHYLFQIYLERPTSFGTTAITAYQLCVMAWAMVGAILYIRRRRPHEIESIEQAVEMPST